MVPSRASRGLGRVCAGPAETAPGVRSGLDQCWPTFGKGDHRHLWRLSATRRMDRSGPVQGGQQVLPVHAGTVVAGGGGGGAVVTGLGAVTGAGAGVGAAGWVVATGWGAGVAAGPGAFGAAVVTDATGAAPAGRAAGAGGATAPTALAAGSTEAAAASSMVVVGSVATVVVAASLVLVAASLAVDAPAADAPAVVAVVGRVGVLLAARGCWAACATPAMPSPNSAKAAPAATRRLPSAACWRRRGCTPAALNTEALEALEAQKPVAAAARAGAVGPLAPADGASASGSPTANVVGSARAAPLGGGRTEPRGAGGATTGSMVIGAVMAERLRGAAAVDARPRAARRARRAAWSCSGSSGADDTVGHTPSWGSPKCAGGPTRWLRAIGQGFPPARSTLGQWCPGLVLSVSRPWSAGVEGLIATSGSKARSTVCRSGRSRSRFPPDPPSDRSERVGRTTGTCRA